MADDFELTDELADEWEGEGDESGVAPGEPGGLTADETEARLQQALNAETRELKSYKALAESIVINAKGEALTQALDAGFRKLAELGAARKALIFTESRRTQRYLYDHLERHGYAGQVVMLNGTNTEPESAAIYRS